MTPLIPVLNKSKRSFVLTLLCTYQHYRYKEIVLEFPRVKRRQMPVSVCIETMTSFGPGKLDPNPFYAFFAQELIGAYFAKIIYVRSESESKNLCLNLEIFVWISILLAKEYK